MITIDRPTSSTSSVSLDAPSTRTRGATFPARLDDPMRTRVTRWPWVLAALAYGQYVVVAVWLLYVRHYAIGDALSRTATAKIMVLSRDPHLGAMGFYWLPLPTLARIPFVLVLQPLGRAELAGPLASALFAALTIPILCAIGRRLGLSVAATAAIAVIFALNPVTIYIAANGMSESTLGFFVALTMYGYLRWRHDGATVSLCVTGLALGGAMASRFEGLVITPTVCLMVMLAAGAGRRLSSAAITALPAIVVFFLWSLASYLIMGDWLFWKRAADELTSTPEDALWLPSDRSLPRLLLHGGYILIALGPAAVLVVVGLLRFPRRWRTSVGVIALIVLLPLVVTWQGYSGTSWNAPRFYILTPMLVTVGVMWLIRSARGAPAWVACFTAAGIVCLAAGTVTATFLLANVKLTVVEGESVFFGALLGRSPDETSLPIGDSQIGFLGTLPPFEQLDRDLAPMFEQGKTLALDSIIAVPMLVSDHPDNFIIPEDRDFEPIIADSIGRVDFILRISSRSTGYGVVLDEVIEGADGGNWLQVGLYGGYIRLYEWVPTGETPAFEASDCCGPPPANAQP